MHWPKILPSRDKAYTYSFVPEISISTLSQYGKPSRARVWHRSQLQAWRQA